MQFVFGVIVHLLLATRTTRWLWLIAAAGWLIGGVLASESSGGQ